MVLGLGALHLKLQSVARPLSAKPLSLGSLVQNDRNPLSSPDSPAGFPARKSGPTVSINVEWVSIPGSKSIGKILYRRHTSRASTKSFHPMSSFPHHIGAFLATATFLAIANALGPRLAKAGIKQSCRDFGKKVTNDALDQVNVSYNSTYRTRPISRP